MVFLLSMSHAEKTGWRVGKFRHRGRRASLLREVGVRADHEPLDRA